MENLRNNPAIEVNVVDPLSRRGYRFKGTGEVLTEGDRFDEAVDFYRERGTSNPIRAVVIVEVDRALPLTSPVYDLGLTEEEVRERWGPLTERRFALPWCLEVELGVAPESRASTNPVDEGTRRVARTAPRSSTTSRDYSLG